jgi:hypothetical protein
METTKAEKRFRVLMAVYAAMFYIGGIQFYSGPDKLLTRINTVGGWLGFTPVPISGEKFWLFLAVSMMFTIATCCLIAALDVGKNMNFAIPVMVSKFVSSTCGLWWFIHATPRGFAYLVIFLTDFPLFVLAILFYAGALTARRGQNNQFASAKTVEFQSPAPKGP